MTISLRHELKFVLEQATVAEIEALIRLHAAHFSEAFSPRSVNSVYFDTPGLRAYRESVSGFGDRIKVRLRWYGALFGDVTAPQAELKVKHGAVGHKRRYAARPFVMRAGLHGSVLEGTLGSCGADPEDAALMAGLVPVLITSYRRRYWASRCGRFRLTVDSDIAYLRVDRTQNGFLCRSSDRDRNVVELKYAREDEPEANRVTGAFPFRPVRSSKYARGVELLYAVSP